MLETDTTTTATTTTTPLRLQNGQVLEVKSNSSVEADEIPIIDVAGIYSEDIQVRKAVAEQIREACHRIGFFYAINHGVDPKYSEEAFHQAKRFFAQPVEKKLELDTANVPDEYFGYFPMETNSRSGAKKKDLMEAFNFGYAAKEDPWSTSDDEGNSVWPSDLPGFREGMYQYHTALLMFARKMSRIFALALHLPEDAFDDYIKKPDAAMRILHYPQQEASVDDQNGIGAHTDFECFTIVTQDDSGGLEVLSKSGQWIRAKPVPGSFVVNIADCFMRQTNDFFVSTVHRVINKSGRERYSIPFFYGFDRTKKLEAVPTCVSADNPMRYPIMTSGEYVLWRAQLAKGAGTY
ncbi:hypothetical protein A1O3_10100 [Capronia epimyces CBS 606.96]|uniref:Fe2OG dioxygenase domain-containing protein n=1 Tax=Capronia epimyces CBS 606.96 TaxID=1182542 RepID=W9X9Q9_9EURO|nr:uncharacterized protein A1O3_10100 [Capronia epimyces CBS 606.96]EXJ76943.1 hypothetical protein A1O3_10100 [Capronia epimyces CBS 606.96]